VNLLWKLSSLKNPKVLKLNEDDFSEPQVIEQQKALHKAGIGTSKDGRVDLIVRYNAGYTAIVELKNGKIEKTMSGNYVNIWEKEIKLSLIKKFLKISKRDLCHQSLPTRNGLAFWLVQI